MCHLHNLPIIERGLLSYFEEVDCSTKEGTDRQLGILSFRAMIQIPPG
jgi:hypothetical protein